MIPISSSKDLRTEIKRYFLRESASLMKLVKVKSK